MNFNNIKIAVRYNNNKRNYLLVNELQAKHIPVNPSVFLKMSKALGSKLKIAYPNTRIVIGLAETATAIGAAATKCMRCKYIQTTREPYINKYQTLNFNEEHSHAIEQMLCCDEFKKWISESEAPVILIDDELTTGKTLINMVEGIRNKFPILKDREFIAASLVNRVTDENMRIMQEYGIINEYILKPEIIDYSSYSRLFSINAPCDISGLSADYTEYIAEKLIHDPRIGCEIDDYDKECCSVFEVIDKEVRKSLTGAKKILVLGTEECMYLALVTAEQIGAAYPTAKLYCHSTSRSPIGVSEDKGYPINNGFKLHSFYDDNRETYIYNLNTYDVVIVITDSEVETAAMKQLTYILKEKGCGKIILVRGR